MTSLIEDKFAGIRLEDWGDDFENAPQIAFELGEWLAMPVLSRRISPIPNREIFCEIHGIGVITLRKLENHLEFKRLRKSLGASQFSADAIALCLENLEAVATAPIDGNTKNLREKLNAITEMLRISGTRTDRLEIGPIVTGPEDRRQKQATESRIAAFDAMSQNSVSLNSGFPKKNFEDPEKNPLTAVPVCG